jgi:hypothetical protein
MYFEQIINVELEKQFSTSGRLSDDFIESILSGDPRNKRQEKTDFILFTDDFRTGLETQIAVRSHQGKLVSLMDKVFLFLPEKYRTDTELPQTQDSVYLLKYLYTCLLSGLNYIERKFRQHLDKDISIPAGEIVALSKRVREELPLISDTPRMHYIHPHLKGIVMKPLMQLAAGMPAQAVITWRYKAYIERLLVQLKTFVCSDELPDTSVLTMELHALLQMINFNNPAYVNYMISSMEDKINEHRSNRDKCVAIIMQQRKIGKCITERTISYDMCQMPLKEQLLEWLGYELDCFESLIRLDALLNVQSGACLN